MKKLLFRSALVLAGVFLLCAGAVAVLAGFQSVPERISYGATFSELRALELGLPWKETYDAMLDELGVRRFRLVAHWTMIEPTPGAYDFADLDYQVKRAEEAGATVVLAVGRRLPSWPECHEPEWLSGLDQGTARDALLAYLRAVVTRYADSPAVSAWQVENEAFLTAFAYEHCGSLDLALYEEEIALVRSLDPSRPVLLTDSGELGPWYPLMKRGGIFGTTLYIHMWNPYIGTFRYPTVPAFYRAKRTLSEWLAGERDPAVLIELSLEPWLLKPIRETELDTQLSRMDLRMFDEVIDFAARTSFSEQYLWGAEWWYYLKTVHGNASYWERAKELFVELP